jgi:hypothetical protein
VGQAQAAAASCSNLKTWGKLPAETTIPGLLRRLCCIYLYMWCACRVVCCGHSLGAALATLGAFWWAKKFPQVLLLLYIVSALCGVRPCLLKLVCLQELQCSARLSTQNRVHVCSALSVYLPNNDVMGDVHVASPVCSKTPQPGSNSCQVPHKLSYVVAY